MADVVDRGTSRLSGEASTAELVQRATEQVSRLVRDELALAKAELTEKARHAGVGAGLFGGAAGLALYGVGALVVAAVLLLALVMPAWLAALIVAVALFVLAGIFALVGKGQVGRATPPVPANAVRSVQADVETIRTAIRERGRA